MNRGLSHYLDALRVGAALAVLASHLAYPRFTDGVYLFIRELNLGSDAVVLFFVLSGLVIAHTAEAKDRTAGRFLFNRATRIYSVAIPALLLTIGFDRLGAALYPDDYDGWWYNAAPIGETLAYGLSFANEWTGQAFRIGTNGPWWSLSYEVAYYLIFAAWSYAAGVRRAVLVAALCLIVGPKVLLLAPAWLLGVATWRAIAAGRPAALSPIAAWTMALLPVAIYAFAQTIHLPALLLHLTGAALGLHDAPPFALLNFSDEFVWNGLLGLLAAAHIVGVAALAARRPAADAAPGVAARAIRWGSGASFSLYLIHYPVLQFFGAAVPADLPMALRHLALLAATVAVCLAAAALFERPLPRWRALVLALAARLSRSRPAPADEPAHT
ncbi:MAG: acyltransferase [Alphaproteobacteria bacterium]